MRFLTRLFFAACLALAALPVLAAPAAIVEAVQMPAWVERRMSGAIARIPLAPQMTLQGGDELKTGPGSRLYIKLAEGSLIKLGENASLRLLDLAPSTAESAFKAALNVLEGAFRFTTEALAKSRRRDVTIQVRTVTAGIRGTDLWGKSTDARQIVCLIEGAIEVKPDNEDALQMNQPLQFYVREGGKSLPVGTVAVDQLKQWAAETEIASGTGASRRGGKWRVTLATTDTMGAALDAGAQLRAAGYATQVRPGKDGDKRVYTVVIGQLPSKAEAEALAEHLRSRFSGYEPKVSM